MFYKDKKNRHFRGRRVKVKDKVVYHPNYIVGETIDKFYSFGLTHSEKRDKSHKNYKLKQNPNYKDKEPSYLRKQIDHVNKSKYTKFKYNDYKKSTTIQMFNNVMNNSKKTVYNSSSNTGYKNSKTIQMFNKVYKPH